MVKQISSADRAEMDRAVLGMQTKSDKIRALAGRGFERADIARYLGIRYQHVRNVLVQDESKSAREAVLEDNMEPCPSFAWTRVGPGGRVVIPAPIREALGLAEGADIQVRLEKGEIRIVPRDTAVQYLQEAVAKYLPKGMNLVDALVDDRREEARREERGD